MPTEAAELLEGQDIEALEEEQAEALETPQAGGAEADEETHVAEGDDDSSQPPVAESDTEPPLSQRLLDLGFENVTNEDAQQRLLETYEQQQRQLEQLQSQMAQLQPLATYGNQYLAQLQQQQAPQAGGAKEEAEQPKPWWEPPKFEHAWMERYREPDTANPGSFKWKENTPAEVIANTQAYQNYIQDWADNLTSRPHEILPPIIKQVVEPLFEQWYQERRGEETSTSFLDDIRTNNDWLYQRDPRTNQLTDQLSAEGQQAMNWASEAQEDFGIEDPKAQWAYVQKMRALHQQQVAAPPPTAAQKAAENRKTHQRRAVTNLPARGGSATEPEQPQNTNFSPGRQLVEALREEGAQWD